MELDWKSPGLNDAEVLPLVMCMVFVSGERIKNFFTEFGSSTPAQRDRILIRLRIRPLLISTLKNRKTSDFFLGSLIDFFI